MYGIQLKSVMHLALLCAAVSLSWCGTDYSPKSSYVVTGDTYPPGDGYTLVRDDIYFVSEMLDVNFVNNRNKSSTTSTPSTTTTATNIPRRKLSTETLQLESTKLFFRMANNRW